MKDRPADRSLSECHLQALVETSDDAIAALDLEGKVTAWNQAAAALCGYSAEEAVGAPLADLVVPRELMHEREDLLGAVAAGESVRRRAVRRRKDGNRMRLTISMAPVRDDHGVVVGSVWVARDDTDRRELEKVERRRSYERRWQERITKALTGDGLVFAAQPLVDLRDGTVARFELLMRMRSGRRLIAPGEFLDYAEQSGQIVGLDRWAIRRGIELARAHPVAINISGASVSDPGVVAEVRAACRRETVDPRRVTFELTETSAARDLDGAARLTGELRELGCGVALDDFGTGFGSLTYLHKLPITELKIDREFIGPGRAHLDRRVIDLVLFAARTFEIQTVAEGVEEPEMLSSLQALGIDLAQGFLLGRPAVVENPDDLRELRRRTDRALAAFAARAPQATPPRAPTEAVGSEAGKGDGDAAWVPHIRRLAATRCDEARRLQTVAADARAEATRSRAERAEIRRRLGRI